MTDSHQHNKKILSIVIPCFNEEEVIRETINQISAFASSLYEMNVEIIFVDDGSKDATSAIIKVAIKNLPDTTLIKLSRNFGHQTAVMAGLEVAKGDAVVIIDADLQDPPYVIHEMISKWHEGYDVAYGLRIDREGETLFKKITAKFFYRFINLISDIKIPVDTGDFRLIDRKILEIIKSMHEQDKYLRGMIAWTGFKQIAIPYKREKRFSGNTKYPLRKMLKFAIDGILSFSTKPLQLSITLGMVSASFALLGIIYALILRVFTNIWVEGWTTLMIAILFVGGIQLISIGILGLYIGRIYKEVKSRPQYLIQEIIKNP